jgi:uncharacterized protein (DUF4213/DUF364 family)
VIYNDPLIVPEESSFMTSSLFKALQDSTLPGRIEQVLIGFSRTAVRVATGSGSSCGLAATLPTPGHVQHRQPVVQQAGNLDGMAAEDLMHLVDSSSQVEVGIGLATTNALLPREPHRWLDLKAESYLFEQASDNRIAVIGHFPFVEKLHSLARQCWVLELEPGEGDLPAASAREVVPQADILAITATTLINGTFDDLMQLRKPGSRVMLLGPSTPLSPVLFDYGVDLLSGSVVVDIDQVMLGIGQASTVHQLRQAGAIRMVTLSRF